MPATAFPPVAIWPSSVVPVVTFPLVSNWSATTPMLPFEVVPAGTPSSFDTKANFFIRRHDDRQGAFLGRKRPLAKWRRIRGVYLEGNAARETVFVERIAPLKDLGATSV